MAAPLRIGAPALAQLLPDLRTLPGPVYRALARFVTALVLDGRVVTGTRLPSERDLAAALGVSRATVTAAYDHLRTEGFVHSRTGSGSYVAVPEGFTARDVGTRWAARTVRTEDVIDLTRATLPAPPDVVQAAVAAAAARLPGHLLDDGYEPEGLPRLRAALAERFTSRGIPTRPEQVLVTSGALHGIDLVLRLLVAQGDRVLTELPTYPGALDAVRAHGGRIVPVPVDPAGGWQVDQMRATLRQTAARLAYVIPDHHNPTGALVGDDARRAVLREARRTGTTVVVDESFVDLGYDGQATRAAAIDPAVISIGSLSKFVWGGLRLGWVRGPADLVGRLGALRTSIDLGAPVLDQLVAAELIDELDTVAGTRRAELLPRRNALLDAVAGALPDWRVDVVPQGGLSLWARLPAPLSTPLAWAAGQAGVVLVPGSRFGVDGTLERFVRLPFAQPVDRLQEAVRRVASVWAEVRDSAPGTTRAPRPMVVA